MRRALTSILLAAACLCATAQATVPDSCSVGHRRPALLSTATYASVPLIAEGWLLTSNSILYTHGQHSLQWMLASKHSVLDAALQYSPLVLSTALKLAGNPGRSSWARYATSAALSVGITYAITAPIKYGVGERRPDGSELTSFPSGHTALAFASATVLHHEYGLTVSPWYSVAGYGLASAAGLMRVIHNRHWMWDVYAGAGVGILSAELAYGITDLIFGRRGLRMPYREASPWPARGSLSIGINMGVEPTERSLDFPVSAEGMGSTLPFRFHHATAASLDAACFVTPHIALGGIVRMRASVAEGFDQVIDIFDEACGGHISDYELSLRSARLTDVSASAAAFFFQPLGGRFALGAKVMAGYSAVDGIDIQAQPAEPSLGSNAQAQPGERASDAWTLLNIGASGAFTCGAGISLTYAANGNMSWRIFADYDTDRHRYTLAFRPYGPSTPPTASSLTQRLHHLTLGTALAFSLQ